MKRIMKKKKKTIKTKKSCAKNPKEKGSVCAWCLTRSQTVREAFARAPAASCYVSFYGAGLAGIISRKICTSIKPDLLNV